MLREDDTLVVTRLDRLARSMKDLVQIGALLKERGVDLVVTERSINTGTVEDQLMFNLLGAIAEFSAIST